MKIKKGDHVKIIRGKDKEKKGKVLKSFPQDNKIVVEGLNLITKHVRPKRQGEKGQRIKMAMPLDISKVMLICPHCKKPVRGGYKILTDGRKKRYCRQCREIF
jgi:large subunit ribosomal protein L24